MDKAFTVSLCNPDKEVYVALDLPAEPYALLDVWERLRPAPGTQVEWEIEDYGEFHILFPSLQSGENLPALNLLAEQLSGLDERQRTAFEGLVRLDSIRSSDIPLSTFIALVEQAKHCHVVPEATDDTRLGRFYAANGFIPEVEGMPDKAFELLDFKRLGRRIRQAEGGIFTRGGYVVPDGAWQPSQNPEPRAAPEPPAGIFRLKLRLGEEQAKLTLPAGRELVEVRERMESIGLSACAVASFHSRVPQIPAEWVTPERLEALNCLAQRLAALAEQESLALTKYKAVLEASPISSLEEAIALTERLDAYNLDRKPATPEDVAREELSCVMMEEDVTLIERYLNIYGYGEALIQQYEGELTNYGPLTRADGRPVQEPLPSHPGLNSIGMRCPRYGQRRTGKASWQTGGAGMAAGAAGGADRAGGDRPGRGHPAPSRPGQYRGGLPAGQPGRV